MSYTLAVESIGRSGSVAAVGADGEVLRAENLGTQPAAAHLVPLIHEVLRQLRPPTATGLGRGPRLVYRLAH